MDVSSARRGPKPKLDTRDNLVQAGLAMLHAEGYAATGVQSIVAGVGVPKGSFYNHFASKEAFGAEVIDAYFARAHAKLRSFLGDTDRAPVDRLKAYFDDLIEGLRTAGLVKGCLMGNFSAEVADHSPLIRAHLARHFETWGDLFEACIAEAQAQGSVADRFPAGDAPLLEFTQIVFGALLV